jgi:hypothetical protein
MQENILESCGVKLNWYDEVQEIMENIKIDKLSKCIHFDQCGGCLVDGDRCEEFSAEDEYIERGRVEWRREWFEYVGGEDCYGDGGLVD